MLAIVRRQDIQCSRGANAPDPEEDKMATQTTIKWSKTTTNSYVGRVNGCVKYEIVQKHAVDETGKSYNVFNVYEFGHQITSGYSVTNAKQFAQYWQNFFAVEDSKKVGA